MSDCKKLYSAVQVQTLEAELQLASETSARLRPLTRGQLCAHMLSHHRDDKTQISWNPDQWIGAYRSDIFIGRLYKPGYCQSE